MQLCACTVSCLGIDALGIDAILYRLGRGSEAYLVVETLARLETEYRGYTVISWLEICLESCRSKEMIVCLDIDDFGTVQRVLDYFEDEQEVRLKY